jgi:regulator of sirC expression with transglutaminase-like and TPR domain
VGFPGHFLVRLDGGRGDPSADFNEPVLIDPFNQGRLLDADALGGLLRQSNVRAPLSSDMLEPARTRHVVARMLMNLRGIYASRGDASRLLLTLDRLIDLLPDLSSELVERAKLYEQLGAPGAALADYQRYLELDPDGAESLSARRSTQRLTRALATQRN